MTPTLRAVTPGEKPAPKAYKTITEALEGSSRDVMVAMRKALAKKLDDGEVSSNAIASAYKELRELDRLIRLSDDEEGERSGPRRGDEAFDASAI